ncbi:MAG: SpvB/TcaC N-terminal domain-containing protein [Pseudomonadota bacterium]
MMSNAAQGSPADRKQAPPPRADARTPAIQLPKGGGAIRSIGEKFAANPVTGTGAMSVPIGTSPGRSGFGPQLALAYDSGAGSGPFGFGWALALPSVTRRTDRGLPQYLDAAESDVFILSGAEDLVPVLRQDAGGNWVRDAAGRALVHEDVIDGFRVRRYRPRLEGLFALIERWSRIDAPADVHWRSISKNNLLTVYGLDAQSRIADPLDAGRIFSWLVCEVRDDKGNAVLYRYKAEDGREVDLGKAHERNRGPRDDPRRTANRYLKRIHYGNRTPLLDGTGHRPRFLDKAQIDTQIADAGWMFEVVLDYGDHDPIVPKPRDDEATDLSGAPVHPWTARADPLSSYRAGFEVRTQRLCRRALMFHHFPGEAGVERDCLVRSTDFSYSSDADPTDARNPVYTFLRAAAQNGYRRAGAGYEKSGTPPVSFEYTEPVVQDTVHEVDADSLANLPIGLDGRAWRWVDLHGEGLPGLLAEQAGAWFYKRNWSPLPQPRPGGGELVKANFAALETVALAPNAALGGGAAFMDLAGDGRFDLVVMEGPGPGLYEHDDAEGWQPFHPFSARLNHDPRDANLRLIDLDGDGHADVLITEDDAFVWHASLAEEGFAAARRVTKALDEERGPRVVFADGTQSIYLADLSGDGLIDIVRIRNGEVCYWPNLGYGKFGAKVSMDGAPWFDQPDQFDHRRIRLADCDGSGTTDILYLHRDGVRLYFNQAGNSWSQPRVLKVFPRVDDLASIVPADLLGNGTACLVWSSPLPGDARRQMRYVDLMGGQKPHLLVRTVNNLGAETRVGYAPSTRFYLQDKRDGKPWITRLPFPVHVVERVETIDHIGRNRMATRYAYHHGYFDGDEREFRGFGMVEQFDAESFEDYVVGVQQAGSTQDTAPLLYQPPVMTRTWYHLGAFLDATRILHQYRGEYHGQQQHLPEPVLPATLDAAGLRECMRALKGSPLRQEIYSDDGSAEAPLPYAVSENSFALTALQPREHQRHGVFLLVGRETISLNYERNPADPRVSHAFGLELDQYGHARKSCAVVYGRKTADPLLPPEVTQDQQRRRITYAETDHTPDIDRRAPDAFRQRVPFEARNYEITGIAPDSGLFRFDEIQAKIAAAAPIGYEAVADGVTAQKRLLSHHRALFLDNALNPLPLGQWDFLALAHESYQLAFTPEVTATHYAGEVGDAEFTAAGYVHFGADANWWIPSGTAVYPADPAKTFYLPVGTRDALGVETRATYDKYVFLLEKTEVKQAAWNAVSCVNDYRVLAPVLVTDPNGNRSAVEHDVLGMVVRSAVMGKAGGTDGDTLADPTTRMEYALFEWMNHGRPNYVHSFVREQHGAANPRWQESYTYSNGSGGVAMVKAQAHPGKALKVEPDGTKVEVDADPRWVGNGRTILNNKGSPVKQYAPYFSTTHGYEDEKVLREIGATPVLFYDAVGRNVRTLFPNGTFAKVEFNPWLRKVFDANDTVKQSAWYAQRGSPDPATPEPLNDPEKRAAWLAAKHADTPGVIHFDSLGRPVYAVADYGGGKTAAARSESDLTGRMSKMFDQQQREIASGFLGMSGVPITGESAEKGRRWTFQNVLGAVVKSWDEHGRRFRAGYDALQRPVATFVQEAGQAEMLVGYIVYGDRLAEADARQRNLLGAVHLIFDQAGMVRMPQLDFKGNPSAVDRILARDYKNTLDWGTLPAQPDVAAIQAAADAALETGEVFSAGSQYDALSRPTRVVLPDGTVLTPSYNEANFLSSLRARIRGIGSSIEFLKNQDYDAKGQRQFAHHGNDVVTRYFYDPQTFRLVNLVACKSGADPQTQALQDLHYQHDPVGNIVQLRDDAQQTHYFNNAVVRPESLYEYDAVYQLVRATGRELAGLGNDSLRTHTDLDAVALPHANNAAAVRSYTEDYEYDLLGNIVQLKHRFKNQFGVGSGWTRHFRHAFDDTPGDRTNRLTATDQPGDADGGPYTGTFDYDGYGNMTRMPHLAALDWNFMDQLRRVDLGGGGTAWYVYGLGGQRLRKVIERNGNQKLEWLFLGTAMVFRRRRRDTNALRLERWTVHISDDGGQIAQVDTKTLDEDGDDPANPLDAALVRYQYANHLGSAALETDENGDPISYEEYHPYGGTAYRSAKAGADLSLKRYRFAGKERDDETGLYYIGARYYAPWLGRWTSSDPAGFADGHNLFAYCRNNPVGRVDPGGTDSDIVNIGEPPADIKEALYTDSPAARAKLEAWYATQAFPDPSEPNEFMMLRPGSLAWNADKKQNWGAFDQVHSVKDADQKDEEKGGPHGNIGSAVTTHDSVLRGQYEKADRANSAAAQDAIADAKKSGDAAAAMSEAEKASTLRNEGRLATQDKVSPPGKWVSQKIEGERGFDKMKDTYSKRLPSSEAKNLPKGAPRGGGPPADEFELARRIAVASGEPRWYMSWAGKAGRYLGPAGMALSGFALGNDIYNRDWGMASGDALTVAGSGLEVFAMFKGGAAATVAGVSAVNLGLVLGGVGISVTSGISAYRAFKSGDNVTGVVDTVGVVAGGAVAVGAGILLASAAGVAVGAGAVAAAPVIIGVGLVAAAGVGIYHLGGWLKGKLF